MGIKECNFRVAKSIVMTIDEKWRDEAPKLSRESFIRSKIKDQLLREKTQYNRMEEQGFKLKIDEKHAYEIPLVEPDGDAFESLADCEVGENETENISFEITDNMYLWAKGCAILANGLLELNKKERLGLSPSPKFVNVGEFVKRRMFIPAFQTMRDQQDKEVLDAEIKALDENLDKQSKAAKKAMAKGIE